jgi:hypothetical protein
MKNKFWGRQREWKLCQPEPAHCELFLAGKYLGLPWEWGRSKASALVGLVREFSQGLNESLIKQSSKRGSE